MDNNLSKLDVFLLNRYGKKIARMKKGKKIYNPISRLIVDFTKSKTCKRKFGYSRDGYRYISEVFFGFSVGKYSAGYEQFWHQVRLIKKIGAFTSISDNNVTIAGNHPVSLISTNTFLYRKNVGFLDQNKDLSTLTKFSPINIGNDVWIGANVTILPGVTIHDGAIIAAGAVVSKDVPPYAIFGGVPAKLIRYRFSHDIIKGLLESQWWNWPDDRIKKAMPLMVNPVEFLSAVKADNPVKSYAV